MRAFTVVQLASIELMLATSHPPVSREGWLDGVKYDGYAASINVHKVLWACEELDRERHVERERRHVERHVGGPVRHRQPAVRRPSGVRYTVSTRSHSIPRNTWFDVQVIRSGILTTVKLNGATIVTLQAQGELRGGGIGVITHWAKGRFDNLSLVEDVSRSPSEL